MQLPSDLEYIPPLRQFIAEVARVEGYPKKFCFRAEIIVDELATNAIMHGSQDINSKVSVIAEFDSDKMKLTIQDEGGTEKSLSNLKRAVYNSGNNHDMKKGRGLVIVQMLSSEMKINLDNQGNTQVHVVKLREPEEGGTKRETLIYESEI